MPPSVLTRLARPGDGDAVSRLLRGVHAAFGEEPPDAGRLRSLVDEALAGTSAIEFLVATTPDGEMVGLLSLGFLPTTLEARAFAYLDDLFVVPEHRGRGVARSLLQAARARALERGAIEIRLAADPDMPRL